MLLLTSSDFGYLYVILLNGSKLHTGALFSFGCHGLPLPESDLEALWRSGRVKVTGYVLIALEVKVEYE